MIPLVQEEKPWQELTVIEKDEPAQITEQESPVEQEIVNDILHTHENEILSETLAPGRKSVNDAYKEKLNNEKQKAISDLELEIKTAEIVPAVEEPEIKPVENVVPYEPTLDLRDYKYPTLDLLETHGSEKISSGCQ